MPQPINRVLVKKYAVDLAFAARNVVRELAAVSGTPEHLEARRIIDEALAGAIPDGNGNGTDEVRKPHRRARSARVVVGAKES